MFKIEMREILILPFFIGYGEDVNNFFTSFLRIIMTLENTLYEKIIVSIL